MNKRLNQLPVLEFFRVKAPSCGPFQGILNHETVTNMSKPKGTLTNPGPALDVPSGNHEFSEHGLSRQVLPSLQP